MSLTFSTDFSLNSGLYSGDGKRTQADVIATWKTAVHARDEPGEGQDTFEKFPDVEYPTCCGPGCQLASSSSTNRLHKLILEQLGRLTSQLAAKPGLTLDRPGG